MRMLVNIGMFGIKLSIQYSEALLLITDSAQSKDCLLPIFTKNRGHYCMRISAIAGTLTGSRFAILSS